MLCRCVWQWQGVKISWDVVNGAAYYYIMKDGTQLRKMAPQDGTQYTDRSVTVGQTYQYKIIVTWDPLHTGSQSTMGRSEEISWTYEKPSVKAYQFNQQQPLLTGSGEAPDMPYGWNGNPLEF